MAHKRETDRVAANRNPSAGARQMNTDANPGNESQLDELNPVITSGWYLGTVISSFPGTYMCNVRLNGHNPSVPCIMLSQGNGYLTGTGANHAWLPIEGSRVLIYKPDRHARVGMIVATIPPVIEQRDKDKTRRWVIPSIDPEPGAGFSTEAAYKNPYLDPNNLDTFTANGGRPLDVLPGQQALVNELGIGYYLGTLGASFKASEMCGIDVFALDDLLRLYSGQFQHFSPLGEQHIYNDGGYQTYEWTGSPHMCETFGYHKYEEEWLTKDNFTSAKMKNQVRKLEKEDLCLHRRYQMYVGHLCGLFSLFVANPDPDIKPNTYPDKNKDQGLFSINVDPSGRLMVSAAGDIILERTDRIPMPKKLKEVWDPTGEQVDMSDPYEEKKPFDWKPDDDPRNRPLWLRDGLAYYKKLLYQRMDEGKKDWYVPEESDLKIPENEYEKLDKVLGSEFFDKLADRRAIICLGADGTITLRADGGAEIVLAGGDIQFNAPGDIRLQSGQNTVVLARDVVLKGRDSVDVTATEKDVRIKAQKNLHLYSDKSILLQSNANTDAHNWPDGKKGEEQEHGGIVLQAKTSRVFLHGRKVHLAAFSEIILETLDTAKGYIRTATKHVLNLFRSMWNVSDRGGGQLINASHQIFGQTVRTVGARGNQMIRGQKVAVITPWADIGGSPYDDFRSMADPQVDQYLNDTDWLGDYAPEKRAQIQFTYRSTKEYGAQDGDPVGPGERKFRVYEPAWMYMAINGHGPDWLPTSFDTWNEKDVEGTYAWPGEAWYRGGNALSRLTVERNWTDYTKPKKRKDRVAAGGTIIQASLSGYRLPKG